MVGPMTSPSATTETLDLRDAITYLFSVGGFASYKQAKRRVTAEIVKYEAHNHTT